VILSPTYVGAVREPKSDQNRKRGTEARNSELHFGYFGYMIGEPN
jgi:hypothetical protein